MNHGLQDGTDRKSLFPIQSYPVLSVVKIFASLYGKKPIPRPIAMLWRLDVDGGAKTVENGRFEIPGPMLIYTPIKVLHRNIVAAEALT